MERKEFLRDIGLAGLSVTSLTLLTSCSRDSDNTIFEDTDTDSQAGSAVSGNCTVTPSETEGPFPTKSPRDYVREDIVGDRTGIPLTIDITVRNANNECNVLEGVMVDIWHCDKDGNYSEYGAGGMQASDYTDDHFLRGRQTTNAEGLVSFSSIFPGWYNGRATHIHVHIYNSSGNSLLVTQIAFPEGENSPVARVNAAKEQGYTKGMTGYTYNNNDNVFRDGVEEELASVSGSISEGFTLIHDTYVSA